MKTTQKIPLILLSIFFLSSCAVINQDEVGVKRKLGRMSQKTIPPGPKAFNPLTSRIITMKVRTINIEIKMGLPSKEGLTVNSEISVLYRIKPTEVPKILRETGINYENVLISPVFRSAAADICAKYDAKDMHSAKRGEIENEILVRMMEVLEPRGFIIEAVLMKSIQLPAGLAKAIEEKLQAEQDAQRMEFVNNREKLEAERKRLFAEGEKQSKIIAAEAEKRSTEIRADARAYEIRTEALASAEANDRLAKTLTTLLIQNKNIEAFEKLARSANAKVIITDGKTPLLGINP